MPLTSEKKCSYSFAYEKCFGCYIIRIPLLRYERTKFKTMLTMLMVKPQLLSVAII